jgi:hypothetical protein
MNGLFSPNGQNLTQFTNAITALQQQQAAQPAPGPRELSLVKVKPFNGRDDEDPYEWIDSFNRAAAANQWADNRKVAIAVGFLKETARAWYEADQANVAQWHLNGNANNFDDRFLAYFSPKTKRNKWYYEFMTIRQTANEEVAQYAHRFKKLLRKVNGRVANQALPAQLQVRMFLYGLNPILTPLVSSNNPADLDAAIDRAKIVETGYNYVLTKEVTVAVPATITQNPPLANPIPTPVNN